MNLSEINWDLNASGNWPTPLKIVAILIVSVLSGDRLALFYYHAAIG